MHMTLLFKKKNIRVIDHETKKQKFKKYIYREIKLSGLWINSYVALKLIKIELSLTSYLIIRNLIILRYFLI